jgi:S-adenosylmethionine hydrolase
MWLDKVYERDGVLHGRVLYADSYGNLHTNLDQATVEAFVSDRPFEVLLRSRQPHENRSDRIQGYYHAVEGQRLTLLYNAIGYLEIALNTNHAESLLGLRVQDQVMIERS